MMRNLKYTAAFAAAVLFAVLSTACTDDPAEPVEPVEPTPLPQSGDLPVCWDVKGVTAASDATRVMIGDDGTGTGTGTSGTSGTKRPTNPAHPDFFVTLDEVCEAPLKEGTGSSENMEYDRESGFAIGLFGDYTYTNNGNKVTFNDLYRGDRLVFLPDVVVDDKVLSQWDTNTALRYWHPGATYIFRAYYPQRLYNYAVQTSNATTLAMVYPSRKLQYDLLFAVSEVVATENTYNADNTLKEKGQMHKPVELKFQHALAALRFQFKLNFEDADFLSSVYLINDENRHFFSQGTAIYGATITADDKTDDDIKKKREKVTWKQDYNPPATEILYRWVPPLKYWYSDKDRTGDGKIDKSGDRDLDDDDRIEVGVGVDLNKNGKIDDNEYETDEQPTDYMLKYWHWADGKFDAGVPEDFPEDLSEDLGSPIVTPDSKMYNPVLMYSTPIKNTDPVKYTSKVANAYFGTEQYYDWKTDKKWKYSHKDYVADDGTPYCRNSGWLLIPPQESFGTLTLCFTTKRGGQTLYKVQLPKETKTVIDENGNLILDPITKEPITSSTDANGNKLGTPAWVAGMRYTYLVTISESNYEINVTIKPWNERKHSTEIIF